MTVIELQIGDDQVAGAPDGSARAVAGVAADVFGWETLRPGLSRAVEAVLAGHDVLGVMPTGYGKSAVYKTAGAMLPGVTVVVSPLIALQADQLSSLTKTAEARPAAAVNSGQAASVNEKTWTALESGDLGYLFLAPEQLSNPEVLARLTAAEVSLFVVDEAHCVASWGHDFRPDYLRLGEVVEAIGRPPILALTATGSRPVREEIVERLRMRDARILTHGFDRPNISLSVIRHADQRAKQDAVVEEVVALPKPGLLYVSTRRATEEYADRLAQRGLRVAAYHAGLGVKRRREVLAAFQAGEYDVVAATSAFGMGIDKADVRFVVHAAITESVDEYYQELGRAGRDGEPASAVLHYRSEDLALRKFFRQAAPRAADLRRFHEAANTKPRLLNDLAEALDMSTRRVTAFASLCEEAGVLTIDAGSVRVLEPDTRIAVDRALAVAQSQQRVDESRIAMMRSYAETQQCRRQYLLGYFGEDSPEPCGNCDTCRSGAATVLTGEHASDDAEDTPYAVDAAVRHRAWGDGTVMSVEGDRVTVFFESEGYRVLSLDALAERNLLDRM